MAFLITEDTAPGVYIDYVTGGPLVVRAVSTSTAVFIGPTVIGTSNVTGTVTPKKVTSLPEYAETFSTPGARSGVVCLPTPGNSFVDDMGHAVRGFFLNGGRTAYIVSMSTGSQARASGVLQVTGSAAGGGERHYRVEALSDGAWGDDVNVAVATSSLGQDHCDITVTLTLDTDGDDAVVTERFIGQSVTPPRSPASSPASSGSSR